MLLSHVTEEAESSQNKSIMTIMPRRSNIVTSNSIIDNILIEQRWSNYTTIIDRTYSGVFQSAATAKGPYVPLYRLFYHTCPRAEECSQSNWSRMGREKSAPR